MAPGHYAYLFDAYGFRQSIAPLIGLLEQDNHRLLHQLTRQYIQEYPNARILLKSFGLSYVYAYYENPDEVYTVPEPGNCLVALLTPFVRPLPEDSAWGDNKWLGFDLMRESLKLVGWMQEEINWFIYGESLCKLLSPHHLPKLRQGRFTSGQTSDPWCAGEPGWLDQQTIENLYYKLLHSKSDILQLAQQPEIFVPRLVNQEILGNSLPREYAHLEQIFTVARIKGKELIVQIVS